MVQALSLIVISCSSPRNLYPSSIALEEFLGWKARNLNVPNSFIESARFYDSAEVEITHRH